jgi:mono/diheme cytochrome c family protein
MRGWVVGIPVIAALLCVSFTLSANRQQSHKSTSIEAAKNAAIYAELAKAPEKARAKRNPLEKDPDAVAAGRVLFKQRCAECHGDSAEGGKKGPNLRAAEVQNADPGAIFWILTNGVVRKGMPVWSKLPEPQRWQLVSYIKSLGTASAEPESAAPAKSPPPKATGPFSPRR